MFGITAFAEAPFTSLGGVSVLIEATGVAGTSALGDETVTAASVFKLSGSAATCTLGSEAVIAGSIVAS